MRSNLIAILSILPLMYIAGCVLYTSDGKSWCIGEISSPPTAPIAGCEELWYKAGLCICTDQTEPLTDV